MKAYSMILGARRDGEGEKEGSSPGSDSIISHLSIYRVKIGRYKVIDVQQHCIVTWKKANNERGNSLFFASRKDVRLRRPIALPLIAATAS